MIFTIFFIFKYRPFSSFIIVSYYNLSLYICLVH